MYALVGRGILDAPVILEQNHTTAGGKQPYFPTENPKIVPIFGGASGRPPPTGLCNKLQFIVLVRSEMMVWKINGEKCPRMD